MLYHCDEVTFKIVSVNRYRNESGYFKVKGRPFHALVFRVSGTGKFLLPTGERFFSSPQDVFFLASGMDYEVEYTDGETIVIHFLSEEYKSVAENYDFAKSTKIYELFCDMVEKWRGNECVYTVNSLFYQLLAQLRAEEQNSAAQDNFYRAVAYMNEYFSDPELNVSQVCDRCGISQSNFRLKFGKIYGEPPIRYLTRIRVAHAVRLLSANMLTVERIAEESGFFDSKYFSRVIKKQYGLSPKQLAKKLSV